MNIHRDRHLASITEKGRERECLNRLLDLTPDGEDLWRSLGVDPWAAWIGLELTFDQLFPAETRQELVGDVDVFVAPFALKLDPRSPEGWATIAASDELFAWSRVAGNAPSAFTAALLREGWMTWPPVIHPTGAAEVKAPYLSLDRRLKASRSGRAAKFRAQALRLIEAGFPRAAYVQLVPTAPDATCSGNPWFDASDRAADALLAAREHCVTKDGDPVAEWIWPIGTVSHKTEDHAGAGAPQLVRCAARVAASERELHRRALMADSLGRAMARWPPPTYSPAFILACQAGCGSLFHSHSPRTRSCRSCPSAPEVE